MRLPRPRANVGAVGSYEKHTRAHGPDIGVHLIAALFLAELRPCVFEGFSATKNFEHQKENFTKYPCPEPK
jgi:hypothetical protein